MSLLKFHPELTKDLGSPCNMLGLRLTRGCWNSPVDPNTGVFLRESQIMLVKYILRLQHHNTVPITSTVQEKKQPIFVMERMTGKASYLIFKDGTVFKGIIEEAEGQEVQFCVRSKLRECIFLNFTSSVANFILPIKSEHLFLLLVIQFKLHHWSLGFHYSNKLGNYNFPPPIHYLLLSLKFSTERMPPRRR